MSEIDDLIAQGEILKAQREAAIELHLAGQHDQASHGSWANGAEEDMSPALKAEREKITNLIIAERKEAGLKPLAANSLRGQAIKRHQELLRKQGREGEIQTRTPSAPKVVVPKEQSPETARAARQRELVLRAERQAAAIAEKEKARAASIEAIRTAERKNTGTAAEHLGTAATEEVARLSRIASRKAEAARAAAEIHGQMSVEHRGAMREATLAEAAVRNASIEGSRNTTSDVRITEPGMAMQSGIRNGVQQAREAIRGAGLVGDYGTVAVKADERGKTRYGAYYPGLNQIVLNDSRGGLPDPEGDGAFTFTHEYGHHIDHFEARRQGFSSGVKDHSKSTEFTKAVRATQAYKDLQIQKKARGSYVPELSARGVPFRDARRATYLSKPTELFARAFAQWVTLKSGGKAAKAVLERRRSDHWSDSDFKSLYDYFEKYFTAKGKG